MMVLSVYLDFAEESEELHPGLLRETVCLGQFQMNAAGLQHMSSAYAC